MKLFRFLDPNSRAAVGAILPDGRIVNLSSTPLCTLTACLESEDPTQTLDTLARQDLPQLDFPSLQLLPPIEKQEVWAAGVTYLRSKSARMDESEFSASAYDRVYDAARPELFFKSTPEKVVGHHDNVGIRRDAQWNVPEPELALFLNSRGRVTGCSIGNDMSSRDIEGENLLYLPQAKIYTRSCAIGPYVVLGASEAEMRHWTIAIQIQRQTQIVFDESTSVGRIKRSFSDLASYLFRSQTFPRGAVLLTGTGIVPPNNFSLQPGDVIRIEVSGIGTLQNNVVQV
jgi:2-dehydro-3-deoxy-D-arabinonate dehydratase